MKDDEIKLRISKFSGNIQAAYNLTQELHSEFNFDLDINFDSTNSFQRFTNMVRNMISRGLIQQPNKSGRTLILDERFFLQFIVARKYLSAGCSMNSLSGYLTEMPTDEIYNRLFAKQLPDIEKVAHRLSISRQMHEGPRQTTKLISEDKLYHHIKIGTGLFLLVQHGPFSEAEIHKMVTGLEKFVTVRRRKKPE